MPGGTALQSGAEKLPGSCRGLLSGLSRPLRRTAKSCSPHRRLVRWSDEPAIAAARHCRRNPRRTRANARRSLPTPSPLHSFQRSSFGRWCNGSTTDFGSVCPGSNPGRPVSHGIAQAVGAGAGEPSARLRAARHASRMSTDQSNTGPQQARRAPSAIILAAGLGKRMNSDLPKVLHEVGGRPMAARWWMPAARRGAVASGWWWVTNRNWFARCSRGSRDVEFAVQDKQLGTGHAAKCRALFESESASREPQSLCWRAMARSSAAPHAPGDAGAAPDRGARCARWRAA